ncbi:hypothetical protein HHI36_008046, partial [Cryptolaemus montrouzieri]
NCVDYYNMSLSSENKTNILNAYNGLRNFVASGGYINETHFNFPEASGMNMLRWKDELSIIAQKWADQCLLNEKHDECRDIQDYSVGQNVYIVEVDSKSEIPLFSEIYKKRWARVMKNLNLRDLIEFNISASTGFKSFSQSIWDTTQYIGCGASLFRNTQQDNESQMRTFRFVCNFGPKGNIPNVASYKIGQPCTECSEHVCHSKYHNLCGSKENKISDIPTNHMGKLFEHVSGTWDWKTKLMSKRIYPKKMPGIWFNGECRCNYIYRSKGMTSSYNYYYIILVLWTII